MSAHAELLLPQDVRWAEALERIPHDVYHTPAYHRLSGLRQSGTPQAFCYEKDDQVFLWPYLLSPIPDASGFHDVSSVYGYPGPVTSPDPEFVGRAWRALLDHWAEQRVVSAFTRFNPLLRNACLFATIPAAREGIHAHGSTVSIDLSIPEEAQFRLYQKKLRQAIRKGRAANLTGFEDTTWSRMDDFVETYRDTMARRESHAEYLVDRAWVEHFRETLGDRAHLFITELDGETAAAMLVITYKPFVHCHLIGSSSKYAKLSPSKVLLDDVRIWATQRGYSSMHLGGGFGGRQDELFKFKSRFSPRTHAFHTGKWILDRPRFRELEANHRTRLAASGLDLSDITHFPPYRYTP